MCKNSYEKYCERSKKNMLYCKLFYNNIDDFDKLCGFQRYCNEIDKYIFHKERECKYYE